MIWIKRLNEYGVANGIILLLIALSFLSMIAQMVGLGIFLPIFEFMFQNDATPASGESQNVVLQYIKLMMNTLGISLSLGSLLITAFLFYMISQIALFIIAITNSYYYGRMSKTIKDRFFKYYLNADSEYYDQVKIGDFINTSTSELNAAVVGVIAPIRLIVSLISAMGSIFILLLLSYELTFYIILIILLMLPYPIVLIRRSTKVGRQDTEFNSILVSFILDRLRSPRLVRLSGTRNSEIREYSVITEKKRKISLTQHLLKEKMALAFEPAIVFSALVGLYVSITYLDLTAASITLFMVILVRLIPIIRNILLHRQTISKSKGPIEAIDGILLEMRTKESKADYINFDSENNITNIINIIKLENVSYSYKDSDIIALSNISLLFNKESINAIIGSSGSGKSTLIDVISSYRKPNSGKVFFDGVENHKNKTISLISYVPQQPQIFDGEIIEHISYGMRNKSLEDIENAAKLSGAHDFIMNLENGYQTILNNNGDNLSGGQRYRVDMARALLSNAPILILDEPTSALDYESRKNLINTLFRIKKDTHKIIIVITHDFSIMHAFDSIVLLQNGEIYAQSTHEELLNLSDWYANGLMSENKKGDS